MVRPLACGRCERDSAAGAASPASAMQERRELLLQLGVVAEREILGARLEEEVERVEHRHLGDQVDLDAELGRSSRGRPAAPGSCDCGSCCQLMKCSAARRSASSCRIARAQCGAGRSRTTCGDEVDRPVVAVVRDVVQRDVDRHPGSRRGAPMPPGGSFRRPTRATRKSRLMPAPSAFTRSRNCVR